MLFIYRAYSPYVDAIFSKLQIMAMKNHHCDLPVVVQSSVNLPKYHICFERNICIKTRLIGFKINNELQLC